MKTYHQITKALYVILLFALLSGCGEQQPTSRPVLSVGMILGSGGLGDRSFNDSAYAGLQEAQRQFGTRFHVITRTTEEADLEELRGLIRQGYDLIIGIGFENAGYIETLAQEHPDRYFAVVDTVVEGDNVACVIYREQEGDFLMGVLAAMLTESKEVGFIGGMDIPPIRRIQSGFEQGVAYQDGEVEVIADLAGTFSDPEIGKSLARAQYEAGADVIYNAAGGTGLGIIEAAREMDRLTIGTSGDQRYLAPGNVVGNRPKQVDTAVLTLIRGLESGQFTPGVRSLGLAEGGLSLGPFDEDLVTDAMANHLEELKAQIVAGELMVQVPEE
ncbi:MAG: BMP family ABC transporter substrate-binding protein [Chloroflexota bacterium]|nr:BMP family ABC transporter substrate-binding protein [Chloroflexota bacterium]